MALNHIDAIADQVFNIGDDPDNAISLKEILEMIKEHVNKDLAIIYEDWHTGDQHYYVSDTLKLHTVTGWFTIHFVESDPIYWNG